MLEEQKSRNIIERYFLEPGEQVTNLSQLGRATMVSSDVQQWRVELLDQVGEGVKSDGYELYEVRPYIAMDPPPRPHGIAFLPDGSTFHLNDDEEFRAFLERVGDRILPLEMAGLMAAYQGKGPHADSHQNLILQTEDLFELLGGRQIDGMPDLVPFQSNKTSDGALTLDFCTFYVKPEPPDDVFRVGLNRWRAELDSERQLNWSVRSIARGLDSPRYSPK